MRSTYLSSLLACTMLTSCAKQVHYDDDVVDRTFYHKYGVPVSSDYWMASGEHGAVVTALADGVIVTRGYDGGLQDGETTYTFPHSEQIQKREFYKRGTLVKEIHYFIDGIPQTEISYDSPIGMKTIAAWYIGGTPKSTEQYSGSLLFFAEYYTLSNTKDASVENYAGTRILRDDYGLILATDTIHNGMLALRTTYHPNNSPRELIPYQNSFVHGLKRTFHPGGEPNTVEEWSRGVQQGTSIVFQQGEKFAEVPYMNGQKQGIERRYRDGQMLVQEISWEEGQLHGPTTTYAGETQKIDWYYKGNPTTEVNYQFMVNPPVVR